MTDRGEMGEGPTLPPAPAPNISADDQHFLYPPSQAEAANVKVFHGPNVVPPPPQTPLPEKLAGHVLIVVGDDISTGDLSPDGVVVMSFCSTIEATATFVFRRLYPQLPTLSQQC